jgi:hypothetical protein
MTPLHWFGDFVRDAMMAVPMGVVRAIFVGLLLALLVWVLRLPKERVQPPEEERGGWSANLKLWAAIALLLQVLIYLLV